MNKLKLAVIILSILLVLQTVAFVFFSLYNNDKSFKKFVNTKISEIMNQTEVSNTNKVNINEIYSYRIYGGIDDDNLSMVKIPRDFDKNKMIYFLGSKVRNNLGDIWFFSIDGDGVITKEVLLGNEKYDEFGTCFDILGSNLFISGEMTQERKTTYIWLLKLTNFLVEWDMIIEGKEKSISPVIKILSSGDVAMAFSTKSINTNSLSLAVGRMSKVGDLTNIMVFVGQNRETPMSIVEFKNGEYWVIGESKSFGFGETDIFVLAFNKDGSVKWFKVFGTKFAESPSSVIQVDDGIIISTSAKHFSFLKINTNGNVEWVKKYSKGSVSSIYHFGTNFIMAGTIYDPYSPNNIFVLKSDESFTPIWEEFYSFNYDEVPYGVFEDDNFVYVCGTSYNDKTLRDIWFVKLKKSTNIVMSNVISNIVDYSDSVQETNISYEIITNIYISSTNKSVFGIGSIYNLPAGIKKRFESENLEKKRKAMEKKKIKKHKKKSK